MGTRITRANLEGVAETLTDVMRRTGVITDRERVVLYGAYGGWAYHVTGGTLEDGTGHRSGVAGLLPNCEPARVAWANGSAVASALYAVINARRDAGL